ncbi:MAG: T9SS type A sorting domain-containing protein, partial [Flavobacteriia bacterium]|nr:T9SS type A sorting domain-containing protein [Flavobacteriia bacterium]
NGTSTGNVTYTRNLPSDNWYLVSSPVVGQVYNNDYVTANSIASGTENPNNRGIGIYETGSDNWSYLQVNGAGTFNPGQGYSVKRTVAGDISFTGTINTSDVSLSLVTGGRGGINLVGNPYTSYINSATFTSTNNGNLNTRSIWIWNQGIGKYDVKPTDVESYIIAPAQGFFVKGKSANNIVFTKANQTNNADTFQKTSNTVVNLFMTDGSVNRYAKVYFVPNATTGYDNGYDGETFVGIEDPFDVFTNLLTDNEGKKYQVQSLPNSDYENMVVPVGISATAGKEIIFTAEALNLPEGIKVFLEDRLTNTMTRLDEINTDYKVTLTESVNGIGRFYLHTKASSVLSTTDVTLQNVSVYTTDKTTLRVVGLTQGKASLKLYNMLGKQVFATSFNSLGVKDLNLPTLSTGIYVVQLETESGKLNKKITLE